RRHRAGARKLCVDGEAQAGRRSRTTEPVCEVQVAGRDLQVLRAVVRQVEHQQAVAAHIAAARVQIDVRLERAQRAGQLHRPGYGALERGGREATAQPLERQRIRRDVGVDAERLTAG